MASKRAKVEPRVVLVPNPDLRYLLGPLSAVAAFAGLYGLYWEACWRLDAWEWIVYMPFVPPVPPAFLGLLALVAAWGLSLPLVRITLVGSEPSAMLERGYVFPLRRNLGSLSGAERVVALELQGFSGEHEVTQWVDVAVDAAAGRIVLAQWPLPGRGLEAAERLARFLGVPCVREKVN